MATNTQLLLEDANETTKRLTGVNPSHPGQAVQLLSERDAFKTYIKGLSEGLEPTTAKEFASLAESTRVKLMENSMFQLNPYESLSLPILRVFYPKLIAKELVNVIPIDKPEVVKGFLRAKFRRNQDTSGTWPHSFPSIDTDISKGRGVTVSAPGSSTVPGTENIFTDIGGGLTSDVAHIEKDFNIFRVQDSTGNTADVSIVPDVDGNFSTSVTVGGSTDQISGSIDFEEGTFVVSSLTGVVRMVYYEAYASLEENQINPETRIEIEKIRLSALDRRISAEWSINMEQDVKALYDIEFQAEIVNVIGEQIAVDVDREIITDLVDVNSAQNPSTHIESFSKTPPAGFSWGTKLWYDNIIPTLNQLSGTIYNSCLMGAANTLACNPVDAAILESLNTFEYAGNSVDGGDLGYRSATVGSGKWKVLVSSNVPQGTVIAKYRSNENARAAYVYAPYVPALLTPYPLGNNPSLTIMTRYAKKAIRPEAIGVLSITS